MDRLARKCASGAQFVQTQPVFDGPAFAEAMAGIPAELSGLPIIMGLSAVRSAEHARRLATIPGIVIPPRLIQLLEGCADDAHASERYWEYLDAELDWLARNAPIRGCHLMPLGHSKRSMRQGSSFDHLYRSAARSTGATATLTPPA
jgi:5,10-methylenetetrahydrofolate reductase